MRGVEVSVSDSRQRGQAVVVRSDPGPTLDLLHHRNADQDQRSERTDGQKHGRAQPCALFRFLLMPVTYPVNYLMAMAFVRAAAVPGFFLLMERFSTPSVKWAFTLSGSAFSGNWKLREKLL